jgi:hypothetical protein
MIQIAKIAGGWAAQNSTNFSKDATVSWGSIVPIAVMIGGPKALRFSQPRATPWGTEAS